MPKYTNPGTYDRGGTGGTSYEGKPPYREYRGKCFVRQREAELELLHALEIARATLGDEHPLVKATLEQMASNERYRAQVEGKAADDFSAAVLG